MSNIVVLDGVESTATLNKLQQDHEPVPPTFVQKSVSGRRHLVFRFPKDQGRLMKNEVKFAPGLDVRTTGGRLVVEASLHYSVSRYEWLTDLQDTPIADIPRACLHMPGSRQIRRRVGHQSQAVLLNYGVAPSVSSFSWPA